jgi:PhnB protein
LNPRLLPNVGTQRIDRAGAGPRSGFSIWTRPAHSATGSTSGDVTKSILSVAVWMLSTMTDRQLRVPPRYARVNAWVISRDTDAEVRFLTSVVGAVETAGSRMLDPDGDIGHVEVQLGDSVIMLFDAKPGWPRTPAHLRVYVDDVAATVEQAVAHGAWVVTRPTLLAFGERVARVRDPQGHLWWSHERVEDGSPDELSSRFADSAAEQALAYL